MMNFDHGSFVFRLLVNMVIFMHNDIFMDLCEVFQLPQAISVF
jgi:hypothetical protein